MINFKWLKYLGIIIVVLAVVYQMATIGVGSTAAYNAFMYGTLSLSIILSLISLVPSKYTLFAPVIGLVVLLVLQGALVGPTSGYLTAYTNFYVVITAIGFILQAAGDAME